MSRRSRGTARARRPRWLIALPVVAIALAATWWVAGQSATPPSVPAPGGGASLAAYRPPDVHALAVLPTDPRTVIFGSHRGVLVSHDGGATWSAASGGAGDAMGLAAPAGSATMYAAGHDVLMRSDDGGATWSSVRPALPGTDIHGFAASPAAPGIQYAYVAGIGLFKSADDRSWTRIGDASGGTMSLAAAKGASGDVLIATTMDGIERSRDGGKNWERVSELGAAYVSAVGDHAYAVAGGAAFVSADGGMTWARRTFMRGGGALIAGAPSDPQLVYVVTDRFEVWRSPDGGATWERAG